MGWPYKVLKKVTYVTYLIAMPDRRKKQRTSVQITVADKVANIAVRFSAQSLIDVWVCYALAIEKWSQCTSFTHMPNFRLVKAVLMVDIVIVVSARMAERKVDWQIGVGDSGQLL